MGSDSSSLSSSRRNCPIFDLISSASRRGTGEPEEKIVAVPHIPKPPVAGIVRVLARQGTAQAPKHPHRIPVSVPCGLRDLILNALVSGFGSTLVASGISRYQPLFNELVEPVQIDVGQDGGSDTVPPCGAPLSVAFHRQSSKYPAWSIRLISCRNRPSWIFTANVETMIV